MATKNEKLLLQALREYETALAGSQDQRDEAREDLSIFDGEGIWDPQLRNSRINDPKGARPCFVISDLGPRVRQITNDVKENKPGIKIRPVDSGADVDTAEVFNGIIRDIEQNSMADIAYEQANWYQTITGLGYFRVILAKNRVDGTPELQIAAIPNPESVLFDAGSLCPIGSEARYVFITEDVPKAEFDESYPDIEAVGWPIGDISTMRLDGWVSESHIRVAEWMRLEDQSTNMIICDDDEEFPEDAYWAMEDRKPVKATRKIVKTVCMWRKMIGNKILKEVELPITYVPVLRVPGDNYIKDGKLVFKGLVRDSRDPVRMVSYMFSSYVESVQVQSKTPYIAAAGQTDTFEQDWSNANIENAAVLHYNPIEDGSGNPLPAPQRQPPPMASQGIITGLTLAQQALKDTSGMGAASLGQKGNEVSGRAIMARQREGDVGSYQYPDNLAKAMRLCGRILLQWIPKVYSNYTVARIIGEDGESDIAHLNPNQPVAKKTVEVTSPTGQIKLRKIYNLGVGRYDVVATVGPSYSTKRVEAAEMMQGLFQQSPEMIQVLGDIYLGNTDIPGAQQMARRLKAMLPPQVQQVDLEEGQEDIPPVLMAQLQQLQAKVQEGQQIVQALASEKEMLEQQLKEKEGEIQAKVHATNTGLRETEIKAMTDVEVATINAESREKIAGLQEQVGHMQAMLKLLMDGINSTAAASAGPKTEA
jgi:hypothetical protein